MLTTSAVPPGEPVGADGLEPPTSCSQSRRANQAALRPAGAMLARWLRRGWTGLDLEGAATDQVHTATDAHAEGLAFRDHLHVELARPTHLLALANEHVSGHPGEPV